MISFDLRCSSGHVFEAWFRSSADFDAHQSGGAIPCPTCGDTQVEKGVMAPSVAMKGNQRAVSVATNDAVPAASTMVSGGPAMAAAMAQMLSAVAQAQAEALTRSRWVGSDFATEARALHAQQAGGATPDAPPGGHTGDAVIHGKATPEEAQALRDEGIAVMPLLVPVVPPELRN